ncbi:MAG TPA: hypothetical protein VH436_03170 [Vicinamibacterales bacterium]|jgi:hypothetical protein
MSPAARSRAAAIALVVPAVLTTLALAAFSGLELLGRTPFAIGRFHNVAEAAGMGAASEVLRLLGNGEDPNRVLPLRGEIISSSVQRATALEAAVWSRRRELVEVLDRRAAIADEQTRQHLVCLARDLDARDIADYLAPGRVPECVQHRELDLVLARTKALEP